MKNQNYGTALLTEEFMQYAATIVKAPDGVVECGERTEARNLLSAFYRESARLLEAAPIINGHDFHGLFHHVNNLAVRAASALECSLE